MVDCHHTYYHCRRHLVVELFAIGFDCFGHDDNNYDNYGGQQPGTDDGSGRGHAG